MRYRNEIYRWAALCLLALCVVLLTPLLTRAQEDGDTVIEIPEPNATDASVDNSEPTVVDEPSDEPGATEAEDSDEVAINLNNVEVDKIMKFLTEITGKTVVKHKDVKAQITVLSAAKMSKDRAFALICDALLLEKVAVVETDDTVKLVPTEMLSEVVVELRPPDADEILAGIIKKVIQLRFTDVEEIAKLVQPLMSKTGTLMAHPASKKIIVTDTATRVANIENIIAVLDVLNVEERQVQIFPLKQASADEIAPILKTVLTVIAQKAAAAGGKPQPGQPPQQQGKPKGPQGPGILDVVAYPTAN